MSYIWLQRRERRFLIKDLKKEKQPEVQRSSVRHKNKAYIYVRQGKKSHNRKTTKNTRRHLENEARKGTKVEREHRELTLPFSHHVGKLVS